jgi:hypothetical protein
VARRQAGFGGRSDGCGIVSAGQGGDGAVRHGRNTTQHDATAPTRARIWLERSPAAGMASRTKAAPETIALTIRQPRLRAVGGSKVEVKRVAASIRVNPASAQFTLCGRTVVFRAEAAAAAGITGPSAPARAWKSGRCWGVLSEQMR